MLADLTNTRRNALRNYQAVVENKTGSSHCSCTISNAPNQKVVDTIIKYVRLRAEGHSAKYALDAIQTGATSDRELTADYHVIRRKFPEIPLSWLRSYFSTNFSGTNITGYVVVDGTVAWEYQVMKPPTGEAEANDFGRIDAMQFDPRYEPIMREVDKLIEEQLKREGVEGLGTCHTFWGRKKKMLLEKGLDWKSPTELNPNTIYD
jgi:hypothetical protein